MDFLAASRKVLDQSNQNQITEQAKITQEHANLREQNERLKQQLSSLSETVKVLGTQNSHYTRITQDHKLQIAALHEQLRQTRQTNETHTDLLGRHAELQQSHSRLQDQCKGLREAVSVLDSKSKAADEKLLLQTQMHANRLRTIEATHGNIKERCASLAVSAEQHRLSSVKLEAANARLQADNFKLESSSAKLQSDNAKLEEKHRSTVRDVERLTELHSKAIQATQSNAIQLSAAKQSVNSHADKLRSRDDEIASLKSNFKSNIEAHAKEAKRLQSKIQAAGALLKAHPIDLMQNAKTKNILASSAEILQLAHDNGSTEGMRQCLGQVAEVLNDLKGQLSSQHRLSQAWLDQLGTVNTAHTVHTVNTVTPT